MSYIKNTSIIFIFFIFVAGCTSKHETNAYSQIGQTGFTCTPSEFNSESQITLKFPTDHPKNLAIETPAGDWFYVADQGSGINMLKNYQHSSQDEITFRVKDLNGIVWKNGKKTIRKVFDQPGHYTLYMADNMETEPENTFSLETKVYYHGKHMK